MIDASHLTLPSGLLSGTTTALGDYDQCIAIHAQEPDIGLISGQYCLATLSVPRESIFNQKVPEKSIRPKWLAPYLKAWLDNDNYYSMASALCFPTQCQASEIRAILRACKFE